MPTRSAFPGGMAIARPSYDARRRLIGGIQGGGWPSGFAGWSTSGTVKAPAEPAFRSPWGDLEQQLPYVTITTRLFPPEWWQPRGLVRSSVARATAEPAVMSDGSAPSTPARRRIVETAEGPVVAIAIEIGDEPTGESSAGAATGPDQRPGLAHPTTETRAPKRRGFLARLAVVTLGLVISLIAVETASRRRH